jgi:hypothetical protein
VATSSGKQIFLVPLLGLLAGVAVLAVLVFYSGGLAAIDSRSFSRIHPGMSKWEVYWAFGAPPGNYGSTNPPPINLGLYANLETVDCLEWSSDRGRFLVYFSKETGLVTNKKQLR